MAQITLDLRNVGGPTEPQEKFAKFISRILEIPLPKEYSFGAYSIFISKYSDDALYTKDELTSNEGFIDFYTEYDDNYYD